MSKNFSIVQHRISMLLNVKFDLFGPLKRPSGKPEKLRRKKIVHISKLGRIFSPLGFSSFHIAKFKKIKIFISNLRSATKFGS